MEVKCTNASAMFFKNFLLQKKHLPGRGFSAPHSSFLQHRLNKIRLQAPFIVPHRKSSNFLKKDHSHDSTGLCKYIPDTQQSAPTDTL